MNTERAQERRQRQQVLLASQVSTPEDSPASRRRRQRRHSQRRVRGLPSGTPTTPVVPLTDDQSCRTNLPMTATLSPVLTQPVNYTADDDVCTTTLSPVREITIMGALL